MKNKNTIYILAAVAFIYYFYNKNKKKPVVDSAKAELASIVNATNFVEDRTTMKDLYMENKEQCK